MRSFKVVTFLLIFSGLPTSSSAWPRDTGWLTALLPSSTSTHVEESTALFLPKRPDIALILEDGKPRALTEDQVAQYIYDGLVHKLRLAGADLSLRLRSFQTIYRSQFSQTPTSDCITLDLPQALRIRATYYGTVEGEANDVLYDLQWEDTPRPARDVVAQPPPSLEDSIDPVATSWSPSQVVAATTFEVRLSFHEDQVSYRAGIFWAVGPDDHLEPHLWDPLLPDIQPVVSARESVLRAVPVRFETGQALAAIDVIFLRE